MVVDVVVVDVDVVDVDVVDVDDDVVCLVCSPELSIAMLNRDTGRAVGVLFRIMYF